MEKITNRQSNRAMFLEKKEFKMFGCITYSKENLRSLNIVHGPTLLHGSHTVHSISWIKFYFDSVTMFSNIHLSSASMRITVITIITVAALVVQEKEKIVRLFEWDFFSSEDFSLKSKPTERNSSATKNECRIAENYFNRRYFRLNNSEISYNITGSQRGNAVECNRTQLTLCEFTMKDVVYCLDSLSAKRNRSPMYIAFVGDSTVRQHFVLFLRVVFLNSTHKLVNLCDMRDLKSSQYWLVVWMFMGCSWYRTMIEKLNEI